MISGNREVLKVEMVTGWLFGKAANAGLRKLRGVLGFTDLESEFNRVIQKWGSDISGQVTVNTQDFFNPNMPQNTIMNKIHKANIPNKTVIILFSAPPYVISMFKQSGHPIIYFPMKDRNTVNTIFNKVQ